MAQDSKAAGGDRPLHETLSGGQKAMITIAAIVALLMQVLDTTIANVAVPHMQASLGATPDTITWVLTSYIVASAIALPITGWLSDRVGRKRLFLMATISFTIFSILCATATSLTEMVMFRALQGAAGAFILPLCQSILFDINPPAKHAQAMAIFSGGMMIGPIMGPVLGGWLTDTFNWRWVFFVNLPVGAAATLLLWRFLPRTKTRENAFDLTGFALLAIAIGAFQLMLDRGAHLDWFDSWEIRVEAGLAIACFWMFGVHTVTTRQPVIPKRLFADRTFLTGAALLAMITLVAFGALALLPALLQSIYGYPVTEAGMLTSPRGFGTMAAMLLMSVIAGKIDERIFVVGGLSMVGASLWLMSGFALEMPQWPIVVSGVLQGFGTGIMMVPLTTIAFSNLAIADRTNASGLINLMRTLGGSVGISIVSTLLARNMQVAHADLTQHVTGSTIALLPPQLTGLPEAAQTGAAMMEAEIMRQATMIAYLDNFHMMAVLCIAVLPLVLLLRKGKQQSGDDAHRVVME